MRILVVSQYFWPEDFRINDLVDGLVERGHEVEVLTGLPNYPGGRFFRGYGWRGPWTQSRNRVRIFRAPLVPRGKKTAIQMALNAASFAIIASLVGLLRCRRRYDAIFVYEPSPVTVVFPGIVLRAFKRTKLVFWVLDLWPLSLTASGLMTSKWLNRLVTYMTRFFYRRCDLVLVPSRGYFKDIRSVAASSKPPIDYLPQWAGEAGSGDGELASLPSLPDGFNVMFAGNIGAAQDFETVLAAAERLRNRPDIHWIIVGDGHMLDWLRSQIEERGLGTLVHCLGRYPSNHMSAFFAKADALLATLRSHPIFAVTVPAKIQSYLEAGKPLITAIDGEVFRLVTQHRVGIAVPASDDFALADAVAHLADLSQTERLVLGRNARSLYEQEYRRDVALDRLEYFLCEVVKPSE